MNEMRSLNVVDLIMSLLKRWKIIVSGMLIVGIIAGGFSYLQSKKNITEETIIQTDVEFTEDEQKAFDRKLEALYKYQGYYDMYDKYLKDSIKMNMDPDKFYEGTVTYLLSADTQTDLLKLVDVYEQAVKSDKFYSNIKTSLGIEIDDVYIQEIITIKFKEYEENAGVLTVSAVHYAEDDCDKILDTIAKELSTVQLSNGVSQYLSSTVLEQSNMSLATEKESIFNMKWYNYDQVKSTKDSFTTKEAEYFEEQFGEEITTDVKAIEEVIVQQPAISVIYIIFGMLVGAILVVGFFALKYLFSERIHSKDDFNGVGNIPLILVSDENAEKKNFVDKYINILEKKVGNISIESLELLMYPIITLAKQENISEVCLSSSLFKNGIQSEFTKQLETLFNESGIKVFVVDSILESLEGLQQAMDCGYIIFDEKCEKSIHREIQKELEKACQCNMEILGIIIEK